MALYYPSKLEKKVRDSSYTVKIRFLLIHCHLILSNTVKGCFKYFNQLVFLKSRINFVVLVNEITSICFGSL